MLKASLSEHPDFSMTDDQIVTLIDATFYEVDINEDGLISKEEYATMVRQSPLLLQHMTLTPGNAMGMGH
ncbi:hypothetical protein KIPB_008911 [Kipferlia bialata]|uniref:EF-hand domain-containing protein n=1 Tax=Kipferlia bialata TaxID=797122 RepID=A0A9K3D361_9EUKA|nr:hypothetical protein KIPB_008911 [Kipferlia bialata]|eukprot:g8911.t1